MAIERYSAVARVFHWTVVLLITAQYVVGWLMPDVHRTTPAEGLIAVHLSLGFAILAVVVARLVWRLTHRPPSLPPYFPVWKARLANLVHGVLYALIVILPVTGWLNASRRTWSPYLFSLLAMPRLSYSTTEIGHALGEWHSLLSWVLLGVIGFHFLAALYDLLSVKEESLWRM
jgi:cytochrome b561